MIMQTDVQLSLHVTAFKLLGHQKHNRRTFATKPIDYLISVIYISLNGLIGYSLFIILIGNKINFSWSLISVKTKCNYN